MLYGLCTVTLSLMLGADPHTQTTDHNRPPAEPVVADDYGTTVIDGYASGEHIPPAIGGSGDQLYPYDSPEPWLHGYFQEIPAYGGFHFFRPYNYKHVLSQSQAAGGWGMSPRMPYSQQFWRRYQEQATMHEGRSHLSAAQHAAESAGLQTRHNIPVQRKLAAHRMYGRHNDPPIMAPTPGTVAAPTTIDPPKTVAPVSYQQ